jgi:hypothetical protein
LAVAVQVHLVQVPLVNHLYFRLSHQLLVMEQILELSAGQILFILAELVRLMELTLAVVVLVVAVMVQAKMAV